MNLYVQHKSMQPSQNSGHSFQTDSLSPLGEGRGDVRVNLASETHYVMYCTHWNPILYIHVEHARQYNSMHHNARCIVHTPCMSLCIMIHHYVTVCLSK